MAKKNSKVVWCDRGWFPAYFGFCPNKKAWDREMKRLGIGCEEYPTTDAKCTVFFNACEKDAAVGKTIILVTIGEHIDTNDHLGIIGLIIHEATHVWQFIREDAGEDIPSKEIDAYAMQNICMSLIDAYSKTRGVGINELDS